MGAFATVREIARVLHSLAEGTDIFGTLKKYSRSSEEMADYSTNSENEHFTRFLNPRFCVAKGSFLVGLEMEIDYDYFYSYATCTCGGYCGTFCDADYDADEGQKVVIVPILRVRFRRGRPKVTLLPYGDRTTWIEGGQYNERGVLETKPWRTVTL